MTAMNHDQLALRETVNDKRPDVNDPDEWPDIVNLPGLLLPVLTLLDAHIEVAAATGVTADRLRHYHQSVREAREALAQLARMSPLEAWRLLHPPRLDPLDGIHDCGHPDCPDAGFSSPQDKELHHRRWRQG